MKRVFAIAVISLLVIVPMLIAGAATAESYTTPLPGEVVQTVAAEEPFTINLTPVFQAIIGLLAALITYRLVPWLKTRTTDQQQLMLTSIVRTLVYAAEQLYGAGHGEEKLAYVCERLKERGYKVDRDEIEAAVYDITHLFDISSHGRDEEKKEPPDEE